MAARKRKKTITPVVAGVPRPYSADSPWNTPIPSDVQVHPRSGEWVSRLADKGKPLTCDVDQYTIPVHRIRPDTPTVDVRIDGYWSDYRSGVRKDRRSVPTFPAVPMPIPEGALGGEGSDGQLVLWDQESGLEWGLWQVTRTAEGYSASNAYVARAGADWAGRFPDGLAGRGAGTPYLAGLVRPEELSAGVIKHALAFGYGSPSRQFVYPASKSDGRGDWDLDLPEGTRLQLDPSISATRLQRWGLRPEAVPIARALQRYGMYVIDNSGSSKIYLEDRTTANWPTALSRDFASPIPWSAFRVVAAPPEVA